MKGTSIISRREINARKINKSLSKGMQFLEGFWREIQVMASLFEVGPVIFGGPEKIVAFLRSKRLLARSMTRTRYNEA